ncbi:MAG: DUF1538 domain-containing protein [Bdellovibrionia bacterium]
MGATTAGKKIKVSFAQAMNILLPYSKHHVMEQFIIVVPVCLYIALFQLTFLQHSLTRVGAITGGILVIVLGLAFFLEGIRIGLVPIGETIGDTLPKVCNMPTVLIFAFILGNLAAFGEPVIGSLQMAGSGVDPAKAPLLYKLLVEHPMVLTLTISLAVGVAVVIGTARFLYGWSLKPIVLPLVGLAVCLTVFASRDHSLATAIGLAWDTGAVIVGPVLCPLVLALGLGVCRATGRADTGMAGFGMVALISILPIMAVMLLTFALSYLGGDAGAHAAAGHAAAETPTIGALALEAFILGVRAIAPIFIFLWCFMRFWLKEEGIPVPQVMVGVVFAIVGLFFFNFGLSVGLGELGNQVGARLPASFHPPETSLYPTEWGKALVVIFGIILGYGATLAEPAFNVLGQQVEDVTQGAFKKWLFCQAVALGVGVGAGFGMLSVVYQVDLLYLLLPPYALLFILTIVSNEKYVNIAWDGGAVTTGPVTVPLKLAIGIALSHATGFAEGFGILALASAYPVLNILLLGVYVKYRKIDPVEEKSAEAA